MKSRTYIASITGTRRSLVLGPVTAFDEDTARTYASEMYQAAPWTIALISEAVR